jgi:hypothetical protein
MRPAFYKGEAGFERHVAFCVLAHNLGDEPAGPRMMNVAPSTRKQLREEIEQLARHAIYGTPSESYRTCGNPRCRCHAQGSKYGPLIYPLPRGGWKNHRLLFAQNRGGRGASRMEAWSQLQTQLRRLSELK